MSKRTPGLYRRPKAGRQEWHIGKWIRHHGRLCESTGTDDEEEAKRYMEQRAREIREALVYGVGRKRMFRGGATEYLTEDAHKASKWRAGPIRSTGTSSNCCSRNWRRICKEWPCST